MKRTVAEIAVLVTVEALAGVCCSGAQCQTQKMSPMSEVEQRGHVGIQNGRQTPRDRLRAVHARIERPPASFALHIPPYWSTGGAWVPNCPILVNREFPFEIALDSEMGAGIAAALRQQANEVVARRIGQLNESGALSQSLSGMQPIGAGEGPTAESLRLLSYAILFGVQDARVQVVLEAAQDRESTVQLGPKRHVAISEARPIEGPESWLEHDGSNLNAALRRGLAEALYTYRVTDESAAPESRSQATNGAGSCPVGGNEQWRGQVVTLKGRAGVQIQHLLVTTPVLTLVTCGTSPTPL